MRFIRNTGLIMMVLGALGGCERKEHKKSGADRQVEKTQRESEPGTKQAHQGAQAREAPGQQRAGAGATNARGTIRSAQRDELIVERSGEPDLRVKLDPQKTQIMQDGQRSSVEQLKPGTSVTISFHTERDKPVADRIEAKSQGSSQQPSRPQ